MKSHSKSYEQYCCIVKKNVVVEETTFHNGEKTFICTMEPQCCGCKNKILKNRFETAEVVKKSVSDN